MSTVGTGGHLPVLRDVLENSGHVQQLDHSGRQIRLMSVLRVHPLRVQRQSPAQEPLSELEVHAQDSQLVQQRSKVCFMVDQEYLVTGGY